MWILYLQMFLPPHVGRDNNPTCPTTTPPSNPSVMSAHKLAPESIAQLVVLPSTSHKKFLLNCSKFRSVHLSPRKLIYFTRFRLWPVPNNTIIYQCLLYFLCCLIVMQNNKCTLRMGKIWTGYLLQVPYECPECPIAGHLPWNNFTKSFFIGFLPSTVYLVYVRSEHILLGSLLSFLSATFYLFYIFFPSEFFSVLLFFSSPRTIGDNLRCMRSSSRTDCCMVSRSIPSIISLLCIEKVFEAWQLFSVVYYIFFG